MRELLTRVAVCALLSTVCGSAVAQRVDPGAINQGSRTTLDYYQQEQFPDPDVDDDATQPRVIGAPVATQDGTMQADSGLALQVTRIVTNPSQLLSEDQVRAALALYENRVLTMGQLQEAAQRLQRMYQSRGRVAARAIIPAQEVKDGVVRIQLVEAQLDEITIANLNSTREDYVRRYIHAEQGELVEIAELEQDLRRFNALHDANLKAALAPGSAFGTTNYQLTIEEPPRFQSLVFVDNAGREDVGLERIGLSFAVASLLGYRDRLALAINFTDELDQGTKGASLAYDFPLNAHGTRASLTYDRSNVVVVSGPIEVLNVRGSAWNAAMSLRQPFFLSPRFRIDTYVTYAAKDSRTDFDDVELFEIETRTITLGADFQFRRPSGGTVMRHQITSDWKGIGGDGTFTRYNGEYTSTRLFAGNVAATFRARVQLGSEALLPSTEQFQLGGITSVRGYDEGLLIGDDGYFLSAEASFPISAERAGSRGFFFLDHGTAYPFKGNDEGTDRNDRLTSIGAGVNFSLSRRITGRLSLGFPLASRSDTDGRDSPRLHFFVQAAAF